MADHPLSSDHVNGLHFGVDSFTPALIAGWAYYSDSNHPVIIELFVNDIPVGCMRADAFRDDLPAIRSDGRFAFAVSLFDGSEWKSAVAASARVMLRDKRTGRELAQTVWDGAAPEGQGGIVDEAGHRLALNKGRLVIPLSERSTDWKASMLEAAADVARVAQEGGFRVAAAYGTLLGAIREGGLIGHDDDIDMMFLSSSDSMLGAVEDFHRLQDHLRSRGFDVVELSNGQMHVAREAEFAVDVFLGWFEQGRLSLTFTVRAGVDCDDVLPLGRVTLEGRDLPAPRNPEALLEAIYGPGWKVPDPAFVWQRPDSITDYFAPIHNYRRGANIDYWREYYGARSRVSPPQLPSQFALFALSVRPPPGLIVDLGCGSGRDTLFFASQKIKTLGLDYAQTAIDANRAAAEQRGVASHAMFRQVDVSDLAQVKAVQDFVARARPDAPLCVYSRFFFHALDENAEGAALMLISQLLDRPGDYAALEFRTKDDEAREKVTPEHYRRYIDVDQFLARASAIYGLQCAYRVEGTGFAIFREDDAHVVRLVLERPLRSA